MTSLVIPLFRALTSDDQDSVRLLAIENSAAIGELLSPDENTQSVLPIVRASVEDRSWRVRFSIAKDFFPLSRAMGTQITESELLGCFTNLLQVRLQWILDWLCDQPLTHNDVLLAHSQDAEAEVRAAAAKNLSGYISIVRIDLFSSEILPLLSTLSQDTAPNVRST